jgi:hypothetical protein
MDGVKVPYESGVVAEVVCKVRHHRIWFAFRIRKLGSDTFHLKYGSLDYW